MRATRVVGDVRQAEVGHTDSLGAAVDQNVRRLDVAMDDPVAVSLGERLSHLQPDANDRDGVETSFSRQAPFERAARNVFHHEIRQSGMVIDTVDGHHLLVRDDGHRPGFSRKPLACRARPRDGRVEHLDRDISIQRAVVTFEDDSRGATPEKT